MAAYEGILFDLDGTLLDTLEDLADSMNEVLGGLGYPTYPVEAYKFFVGEGVEVLVRRVLPEERRTPEIIEQALGDMREVYGRRWRLNTRPYAGVPELLGALSGRGLKLAILSNKVDAFTQIMVADLLAPWRFERVLGARRPTPKNRTRPGHWRLPGRLGFLRQNFYTWATPRST